MYDYSVCWVMLSIIFCNPSPPVPPEQPAISFLVPEYSPSGAIVGAVLADPSGFSDFRILADGSNGLFAVDPVTGQLTVAPEMTLPAASADTWLLEIEATEVRSEDSELQAEFAASLLEAGVTADQLAPLLRRTKAFPVSIQLLDVPEPPQFAPHRFSISEPFDSGSVIGTLIASDPDVNDLLTYSVHGGSDLALFEVDAVSGAVRVGNSVQLMDAQIRQYELRIRVTDSSGLFAEAPVFVDIDVKTAVQPESDNHPALPEPPILPDSGLQPLLPATEELPSELVSTTDSVVTEPRNEQSVEAAASVEAATTAETGNPPADSSEWSALISVANLPWICGLVFVVGLLSGSILSVVWMRSRRSVPVDQAARLEESSIEQEQQLLVQIQQLQQELHMSEEIAHKSQSLEQLAQDQSTLIELLQQELQDCRSEMERMAAAGDVDSQSTRMIQLLKSEVEQRNLLITSLRDQLEALVESNVSVVSEQPVAASAAANGKPSENHSGDLGCSPAPTELTPFNPEADLRAELAELFELQKQSVKGDGLPAVDAATALNRPDAAESAPALTTDPEVQVNVTTSHNSGLGSAETDYDEYIRRYMSNLLNKKDYEPYASPEVRVQTPQDTVPSVEVTEERRVADRRCTTYADQLTEESATCRIGNRPKIDTESLRDKTNSFRQIALQSVEQALASHVKRKARIGLIVRTVLLATLMVATILVVSANALKAIQLQPLNWLMGLLVVLSTAELIIRIRAVRVHSKLPANLDSASKPG